MRRKVVLVKIEKLKAHELVKQSRVRELTVKIRKEGCIKSPVVVDSKTNVVLDGHHRLAALKTLGAKLVPVFPVRYFGNEVKVYLRRRKLMERLIKEAVVRRALEFEPFPVRTTRHYISGRRPRVKVYLADLL